MNVIKLKNGIDNSEETKVNQGEIEIKEESEYEVEGEDGMEEEGSYQEENLSDANNQSEDGIEGEEEEEDEFAAGSNKNEMPIAETRRVRQSPRSKNLRHNYFTRATSAPYSTTRPKRNHNNASSPSPRNVPQNSLNHQNNNHNNNADTLESTRNSPEPDHTEQLESPLTAHEQDPEELINEQETTPIVTPEEIDKAMELLRRYHMYATLHKLRSMTIVRPQQINSAEHEQARRVYRNLKRFVGDDVAEVYRAEVIDRHNKNIDTAKKFDPAIEKN
ncbi:hypothetical protein G9A89_012435 [Geosiphon pyriformis]|nr:hypothetical protein G9A89_012435 [Geosiphon pyriformis]